MDDETTVGILIQIRDELRHLGAEMARVDERSLNTNKELTRLRDSEVAPLAEMVEKNHNRSTRNSMALSAFATATLILFSWGLGLLPI